MVRLASPPSTPTSTDVSVLGFGATRDGETDDTAAIQQALDHVANLADGGTVYLPAGIYYVTNCLVLQSNVRLLGAGTGQTTIRGKAGAYAGRSGVPTSATIVGAGVDHCSVEGVTVDHQTNGTNANGIAFVPADTFAGTVSTDVAIRDCEVLGAGSTYHSYLIWSMRSQRVQIVGNTVDGYVTSGWSETSAQEGIEVFGGHDVLVSGNTVRRVMNAGINVGAADNVANTETVGIRIVDNHCLSCNFGIALGTGYDGVGGTNTGAQNMIDVIAAGNVLRSSQDHGIRLKMGTAGTTLTNVQIRGNVIDVAPIGIEVLGVSSDTGHRGVAVADNTIKGCTTTSVGALYLATVNGVAVNGNTIASSSGEAIRVATCTDVTLRGNTVDTCVKQAVVADTCTRLVVNDNRFQNYATDGTTGGFISTNTASLEVCRNSWSQSNAGTDILASGTTAIVADNRFLGGGAANHVQNTCTNANTGTVSPTASASVTVTNALATSTVNTGAHIEVTQTAGTAKPVTVTRAAGGFMLTPASNFAGNETYAWVIR